MSSEAGTVLWYRPTLGKGMVVADSGRRLFFSGVADLDPSAGLRLRFEIGAPPSGGPVEAINVCLLGGQRTMVEPPPAEPPKKKTVRKRTTSTKTPRAKATGPKPKQGEARRLVRKPGEALAEGTAVFHSERGAGHVRNSSKEFARVEFMSGETLTVSVSELTNVEGK